VARRYLRPFLKRAKALFRGLAVLNSRLAEKPPFAVLAFLANVERGNRPMIAHDSRPDFATLALVGV